MSVPPEAIISTPAACPAEVRLVSEMRVAKKAEMPLLTAKIPNPKETERYPKKIGTPCRTPLKNIFRLSKNSTPLFPTYMIANKAEKCKSGKRSDGVIPKGNVPFCEKFKKKHLGLPERAIKVTALTPKIC